MSPIRTNPFSVDSINQAKRRTEKQNRSHGAQARNVQNHTAQNHSQQNHSQRDSMTSAGSLPDARFHSEQFRRSVMEAFLSGDFNTSPPAARKTKSLQQTVFDESYFRRSVEHSIQAADFELSRAVKAPTNSVPVTGFDAYQFDLSVEQSLRSGDFRGPNTPRKKKLSVATGRALSTPLQGKWWLPTRTR